MGMGMGEADAPSPPRSLNPQHPISHPHMCLYILWLTIAHAAGYAYLDGEELHLTPYEYKLLCLLAHNVGKVLTHSYITREIWGAAWEGDVASLRV